MTLSVYVTKTYVTSLLLQDISLPWFNMHGECLWVYYFCLPQRQFEGTPKVGICIAPIWEYQSLFCATYNNPNLEKYLDYAWAGAMVMGRRCDLERDDPKFKEMLNGHVSFFLDRISSANQEVKPMNALSLAIEAVLRHDENYKVFRQFWCAPPLNFSSAINWKAYDYWYFSSNVAWPKEGATFGPNKEVLSEPKAGHI